MKFVTDGHAKYGFEILSPYNPETKQINTCHGRNNAIFLAGPCPRKDYGTDWRFDAFRILNDLGFTGTVYTPTNEHYSDMVESYNGDARAALKAQTEWERQAMYHASVIVFWIPRSEQWPARTTNIEFGEWYKKPGVLIGWPDGALKNEYLEIKMSEQNKARFVSLHAILSAAVDDLKRAGTVFFTSDTHFSQQRTLELSRRPFTNVEEMDLTLISNWNKVVRNTDLVVHAGDFMDTDKIDNLRAMLDRLNFSELHWTFGNYDRKVKDQILNVVNSYGRKIRVHDASTGNMCTFTDQGKKYGIVHEPTDFTYASGKDVYLFGHIHGRSFAKSNGFDLATDYHNYTPISISQVRWFVNAMNYWDKNVYADKVSIK